MAKVPDWVDLRHCLAVGTGPTSHLAQVPPADLHVPILSRVHAVSTAEVSYLAGLTDGSVRPAARSSEMIWRKFSMPSSVKAVTPSSPKP